MEAVIPIDRMVFLWYYHNTSCDRYSQLEPTGVSNKTAITTLVIDIQGRSFQCLMAIFHRQAYSRILGQMTIRAMDEELFGAHAPTPAFRNAVVDRAFAESRASLQVALTHLRTLRNDTNGLPNSSDPAFGNAMLKLLTKHKRNIAVGL